MCIEQTAAGTVRETAPAHCKLHCWKKKLILACFFDILSSATVSESKSKLNVLPLNMSFSY